MMDSGLAPPKSALADFGIIYCRFRVNPKSVARPGMTRGSHAATKRYARSFRST